MRSRIPAVAFVLSIFALATVGASQARAATGDGLRALLAHLSAADENVTKLSIDYFDLAVAGAITGKRGIDSVLPMAARVHILHFGDMLILAEGWKEKAGFTLAEVEAFASAGKPPDSLHLIRLASSVTLESLTAAWAAREFREVASGDVKLWGRGEPRTLDLSKVDSEDPFGGNLGRSSFLLPALPWIVESFGPEPLAKVARAKASGVLAGRADIAALLAAVDRESGQLLQAMLLPDPAATMLTKEGEQIAFSAFLIADVEAEAQAATLIFLALRECGAARAVLNFVEQSWAAQPPNVSAHKPVWNVRQGSTCVLVGRIAAPGAPAARNFANPSFRVMVNAWRARELTAFVISPNR